MCRLSPPTRFAARKVRAGLLISPTSLRKVREMLGSFATWMARKKKAPLRTARLVLESLEMRDCPAVISLDALLLPAHQVQLSGYVSQDPPASTGATISIGSDGSSGALI